MNVDRAPEGLRHHDHAGANAGIAGCFSHQRANRVPPSALATSPLSRLIAAYRAGLASADFSAGARRASPVPNVSLFPCPRLHPAGESARLDQTPDTGLLASTPMGLNHPTQHAQLLWTHDQSGSSIIFESARRPLARLRTPRRSNAPCEISPSRLPMRTKKPEVSARDRGSSLHEGFSVHLSPRIVREAAISSSWAAHHPRLSRSVGRREVPSPDRGKAITYHFARLPPEMSRHARRVARSNPREPAPHERALERLEPPERDRDCRAVDREARCASRIEN